jgi:hypothetical protein
VRSDLSCHRLAGAMDYFAETGIAILRQGVGDHLPRGHRLALVPGSSIGFIATTADLRDRRSIGGGKPKIGSQVPKEGL